MREKKRHDDSIAASPQSQLFLSLLKSKSSFSKKINVVEKVPNNNCSLFANLNKDVDLTQTRNIKKENWRRKIKEKHRSCLDGLIRGVVSTKENMTKNINKSTSYFGSPGIKHENKYDRVAKRCYGIDGNEITELKHVTKDSSENDIIMEENSDLFSEETYYKDGETQTLPSKPNFGRKLQSKEAKKLKNDGRLDYLLHTSKILQEPLKTSTIIGGIHTSSSLYGEVMQRTSSSDENKDDSLRMFNSPHKLIKPPSLQKIPACSNIDMKKLTPKIANCYPQFLENHEMISAPFLPPANKKKLIISSTCSEILHKNRSSNSIFYRDNEKSEMTPIQLITTKKCFTSASKKQGSHTTPFRSKTSFIKGDLITPISSSFNSPLVGTSPLSATTSPGGFALMRVLESLRYDPESPTSISSRKSHCHSNGQDGNMKALKKDINYMENDRNTGLDEWKEAQLDLPSFFSNILSFKTEKNYNRNFLSYKVKLSKTIDWSLKKSLRIECYPERCLPGSTYLLSHVKGQDPCDYSHVLDEGRIQRLTLELFLNSSNCIHGQSNINTMKVPPNLSITSSNNTDEKITDIYEQEWVLANWKAGLMYWQHPSIHPLPLPICESISNNTVTNDRRRHSNLFSSNLHFKRYSNKSSSNLKHIVQSSVPLTTNDLIKEVNSMDECSSLRRRVRMASIGCLGGMGKILGGVDDRAEDTNRKYMVSLSDLWQRRLVEWQECFQSMFRCWMKRIDEMNVKDNEVKYSNDENVDRESFYSIGQDRVVLFRTRRKQNLFVPIAVLSSTTFEMRRMLRSMGATLRMSRKWSAGTKLTHKSNEGVGEEFQEDLIENWTKPLSNTDDNREENHQTFQVELEALRKASTQGQTAGADIHFNTVRSKTLQSQSRPPSPFSFPPLFLEGHEDCMTFMEYFLNTYGGMTYRINNISSPIVSDVPLLVCRSIGPCMHTTLRSLLLTGRRDEQNRFLIDNEPENQSKNNHKLHSTLEIRGPILPCAVKDLLCASAMTLLLDKKRILKLQKMKHCEVSMYKMATAQRSVDCEEVDDTSVGSHYFVLHMHTYEGEEGFLTASSSTSRKVEDSNRRAIWRSGTIGSSASLYFNGLMTQDDDCLNKITNNFSQDNFGTIIKSRQCRHGEVVSMTVWDVTRPFSIAFKCEVLHQ